MVSAAPLSARRLGTRLRILSAALVVFAERGVCGASVEKICQQAGLTRGAFYSNFSHLDDLVAVLLRHEPHSATGPRTASTGCQPRPHDGGAVQSEPDLAKELLAFIDQDIYGRIPDRVALLVERELELHVTRVPNLQALYADVQEARRQRLARHLTRKVDIASLELTVPLETAVELLMAAHRHCRGQALDGRQPDLAPWHDLVDTLARELRPAPRDGHVEPDGRHWPR